MPDHVEGRRSWWGGRPGQILRILVSLTLLLLLAWIVDLGELADVLFAADGRLLGLALIVAFADRALMIGKWYPLLRVQGLDVPLTQATRVYLAAGFASMFLPTLVGGDLLRTLALGGKRGATLEVAASVVMERMLGLAASVAVCFVVLLLALAQAFPLAFLVPWVAAVGAVPIGILLLALWPGRGRGLERYRERRWFQLAERFGLAWTLYRHHLGTLFVVGLLTLVEQTFPILVFWVLAHALDLEVPLLALLVAVPLTLFVGRLPIAVAGIGVVEGALVYLLAVFGVPSAQALSLALAGRLIDIAALLPGAPFWSSLVATRRDERDGP